MCAGQVIHYAIEAAALLVAAGLYWWHFRENREDE